MKMFSIVDGSEMLEVKVDEGVSLYTCDSGYTSNKYITGSNSGTLFYMAGVKSYEWNIVIIFLSRYFYG